jgi:hypothetical protein
MEGLPVGGPTLAGESADWSAAGAGRIQRGAGTRTRVWFPQTGLCHTASAARSQQQA